MVMTEESNIKVFEENTAPIAEFPEQIKLTKNAKGQYQWEIKVIGSIDKTISKKDIERLEEIDAELNRKWGELA